MESSFFDVSTQDHGILCLWPRYSGRSLSWWTHTHTFSFFTPWGTMWHSHFTYWHVYERKGKKTENPEETHENMVRTSIHRGTRVQDRTSIPEVLSLPSATHPVLVNNDSKLEFKACAVSAVIKSVFSLAPLFFSFFATVIFYCKIHA